MHHVSLRFRLRQKTEIPLRNFDHRRVDVVKTEVVAPLAVGRQSTGAESDDAHPPAGLTAGIEHPPHSGFRAEVDRRQAAALRGEELESVQSDSVVQGPRRHVARAPVAHLERAIEIADPHHVGISRAVAQGEHDGQHGEESQAEQALGGESEEQGKGQQDAAGDADRQFQVGAENVGRHQTHKHGAQGAAKGDHEVEEGQPVSRVGLGFGQFSVAKHAADEQRGREHGDLPFQAAHGPLERDPQAHGNPGQRQEPAE